MDNELLLLSKNDIPFIEAQISVHQPTLNEISLIGEEAFLKACQIVNINKENFSSEDKVGLEDKSNFDIFMSIMSSKEKAEYKNNVLMLFALLFPEFSFKLTGNEIILLGQTTTTRINNTNFDVLKDIVNSIFGLNESNGADAEYNPVDARAAKIAEKLKRGKQRLGKDNDGNQKVAIFSRLVSILSVGLAKDINELMNYTVFQIKDEFKRFQLKQSWDMYIQAKMAGAQDLDEVDNWMDTIHS